MGHKDELAGREGEPGEEASRDALRAAERIAWDRLQSVVRDGSPAQMREEMGRWSNAMRALRGVHASETFDAVQRTLCQMRASAALLVQHQPRGVASGLGAGAPPVGQRLRARDGTVWAVTEVARDALEPACFLLQLEEVGSPAPRTLEVYSDDWPLHCIAHGLRVA